MTGRDKLLSRKALVDWEITGHLPDQESYDAACKELNEVEGLAGRLRKFIEACQRHENSRHSPPNSLQRWKKDSAPAEN